MGVGSSTDAAEYEDQSPSVAGELAYAQAAAAAHTSSSSYAPSYYNGNQAVGPPDAYSPRAYAAGPVAPRTEIQGSLWSGPPTALAPAELDDGRHMLGSEVRDDHVRDAHRWFLPQSTTLFPAGSQMRTARGARSIDTTPLRVGIPVAGPTVAAVKTTAEELAAPMRPTRASLETDNAVLCASVGAARALQDALAKKVRNMREALARGDISYGLGDSGSEESFSSTSLGLQAYRMQTVSLEAELDRYRDKIRAHSSVSERQRREMATLKHDSTLQGQRATTARNEATEARDRLKKCRQEVAELTRKAKTEQLRVEMLREAFEQEQTRVGVSLGRAETFVSDLVAATEGTRRVEVEEQTLARECVSALSEIHAAEARDELAADSDCRRLRKELNLAEVALSENSSQEHPNGGKEDMAAAIAAAAAYANVQSERHAAATELSDARRRCHAVSLIARRCRTNEAELRKDAEAVAAEFNALASEGKAKDKASSTRTPRMQLEEAAEAAMRKAEVKIAGIISAAQQKGLDLGSGRRQLSPLADSARQCSRSFGMELELVRTQLGEMRAVSVPPSSGSGQADWQLDLEAAGLQRRLGKVLASERERYCQLLEARLRSGQLHPKDLCVSTSSPSKAVAEDKSVNMLQAQVKVLRTELNLKDAEIDRLTKASVAKGNSVPARGRTMR